MMSIAAIRVILYWGVILDLILCCPMNTEYTPNPALPSYPGHLLPHLPALPRFNDNSSEVAGNGSNRSKIGCIKQHLTNPAKAIILVNKTNRSIVKYRIIIHFRSSKRCDDLLVIT
jgi:hypothetical protein